MNNFSRRQLIKGLSFTFCSPALVRAQSAEGLSSRSPSSSVLQALNRKKGLHPRLHITARRIEQLKISIQTTHAEIWRKIQQQADSIVASQPPVYRELDNNLAGPEQNWQRDVGNNLPFLALSYLLTQDKRYLESARQWSLASCSYPHWGIGHSEGNDLAAAHQLYGLSLVYDWLYHELDAKTRQTVVQTLFERARVMHRATGTQYWRNEFLQNHLWVNVASLATVGFSLFDEPGGEEQSLSWIDTALTKFRQTEMALGPDGASHEGVSYWGYGVEYMLKFWQLAEESLGETIWNCWWRQTPFYRLYMGLPRASWTKESTIVDIGDCFRWGRYGPDYSLRRLADLYRDGHAQWLARELAHANVTIPISDWLNLLWYNPDVPELSPSDLPTLRHFEDMGIVSARSGWSGKESLLVFKCGPALGHQGTLRFDYDSGSGHAHPDANHFVLFGNGEWLIRDDGYLWKMTDQHNTLLVDGKGQLGEGFQWFHGKSQLTPKKVLPYVLRTSSNPDLDHIVGDATQAYPADLGLRCFLRQILFLKPNVLIVADDIELDQPHQLELRFHAENPSAKETDGAYICPGRTAVLRLHPLSLDGVRVTAGNLPAKDIGGKEISLFTIRLEKREAHWRNVVALSWSEVEQTLVTIWAEQNKDRWTFRAGPRSVVLNWDATPPQVS